MIPMTHKNTGISYPEMDRDLRRALANAIRRSPKKRPQIAEELTAIVGVRVTEHMLNDFTSDNKKGVRFPLLFSAALCDILNDDSIAFLAVRPRIRSLVEFAEREIAGFRDQRERETLRDSLLSEPVSSGARHSISRRKDSLQPSLPMDGQS
jgi:hypothetical protein